jgi:molybdopterin synthase catalytic subunit
MRTVRVQAEDFDAGAEARALTAGRADVGALVSFVGLCRD